MIPPPIRATFAHAAALAAIHATSFHGAEAWGTAWIGTQLVMPGNFGLLHPDGAMLLARVVADEAEILTLAVAPEQRRRGLARALLLAAHAGAAEAGARTMFLEVAAGNRAAQSLYAACGYRVTGRRPGYYDDGTDAVLLACDISPGVATGG